MDIDLTRALESLLFPPGGPLLLAAAGLLLVRWRPRAGITVAAAAILLLWCASLPVVSYALLHALEDYPALDTDALRAADAGAIVVLGAGRYPAAPEYGGADTVSRHALERLRYAALVHRVTGLPVVVTGGRPQDEGVPEAQFLGEYMERELNVTPVWREDASRTTAENARYTTELLRRHGIRRVLLVTHAWHQPRAVESFRREGIEVIPAPTGFAAGAPRRGLPSAQALADTATALHEWVGRAVYALRARLD